MTRFLLAFAILVSTATASATQDPITFAIGQVGSWVDGAASRQIWAVKVAPEDSSRVDVVVTDDGLLDDSIRSERVVLKLASKADGSWKIVGRSTQYRCWPGRGPTEFQPKPCH